MRMITILLISTLLIGGFLTLITSRSLAVSGVLNEQGSDLMKDQPKDYPIATLAGGCFWCIESEFRALNGVLYTRVGYTGGTKDNPTYQDITTGKTGHAEAVEITFDPDKITYEKLITFFLTKAHDPTQLNRQGVDVGTQYRSEIFFHNEEQERTAKEIINKVNGQKIYAAPIVTKTSPASTFWLGEGYHQQYYEKYEKENGEVHPRVFFKKKMKMLKQ